MVRVGGCREEGGIVDELDNQVITDGDNNCVSDHTGTPGIGDEFYEDGDGEDGIDGGKVEKLDKPDNQDTEEQSSTRTLEKPVPGSSSIILTQPALQPSAKVSGNKVRIFCVCTLH